MFKFKRTIFVVLVLIIFTAGIFATIGNLSINAEEEGQTREEREEIIREISKNIFSDIAAEVEPGVVEVTTEVPVTGRRSPFGDPFFEFFFEEFPEREEDPDRREEGFGSGFIVSEEGYVVTNEHVIANAEKITVSAEHFEEPVKAEVVWDRREYDLAILKIDTDEELTALNLGDSDQIRQGDWAIAIGNPYGFEHTVTTGVISALDRPITVPDPEGGQRRYESLIQTDAAINPGNSGGPLVNIEGEVVGINTAVHITAQGIGFAIPINEVKHYVNQLKETGEIVTPWLGVRYYPYGEITDDMKEYYGLGDQKGAFVIDVEDGSPAEEAGLERYDLITELAEYEIDEDTALKDIVLNLEVGERIPVRIYRAGDVELKFIEVGRREDR